MKTLPRFHAFTLAHLLLLAFVGLAMGRPLVLLAADPNACGPQQDYRRSMPMVDRLPADPNLATGAVLGPVPGDPNTWDIAAGPYKRDYARACDPEGDEFSIRYLGGTSPAEPQLDRDTGRWTFAAIAVVGLNAWQFEASDGRATRRVWVMAWGLADEPPVLE